MAYIAPFIDETGLHIPLYTEIRDDLIGQMKQIFGNDIYIDPDSMDYQQISIFARKIYDSFLLAQMVYNNRSILTAIGVGLDNAVVFGNIQRKPPTFSTVQLTLTGVVGSVIRNGEATDGTNVWSLPEEVTIPLNGTITVNATSKEPGNFQALPNSINKIVTPVYGWTSVTNNYAAEPGTEAENDASLRGRFGRATRKTSVTVFEGIWAAVESIDEVTRVKGYENDTGGTSTGTVPAGIPAGLPPHSVTFVVEGGGDEEIASNIYNKKTPGCYTNGTTEVHLQSIVGNVNVIRFYRPTYKTVYVKVSLKKLASYNDEYSTKIKQAIAEYINGMELGNPVYRSIIWSVATSVMGSIKDPAYSVTDVQFSTDGTTYSPADVIPQFFEAAQIQESQITVEVS